MTSNYKATKESFGLWLQKQRKVRNWSQSDLGRHSGVDIAIINEIESDISAPSSETLSRLANALEMPSEMILYFAGLLLIDLDDDMQEILYKIYYLTPGRRKIANFLLEFLPPYKRTGRLPHA